VASGFAIDKRHTFLGYLSFHGTEAAGGVHEQITARAIRRGMSAAPARLVAQIQAGAENVDVTHHFDAEYHFDSASTTAFPQRFVAAFKQLNSHLNGARPLADRNPEFFRPSFGSYRAIVSQLPAALRQLAGDPGCASCDRGRLRRLADALDPAENKQLARALAVNPNPDPHPPTNPESAFGSVSKTSCGLCGKLAGVRTEYLTLMTRVNRAVAFARGQSSRLKESSPVRRRIQRISDQLRAYRAFQALGHAFHSAQDFFAHSNYVELMAGVEVEQPIRKGTKIPVPQRRADFGTTGLRAIMGAQRYGKLESGSAAAIWLGEGDYCLGSPYNPDTKFTLSIPAGIADTLGLPRQLSTPRIGKNPRPPKGLNYCHYPSKTVNGVRTPGLNKDEPGNKEPSLVNHSYARQAAEDMTAVLWKSFLTTVNKPTAREDPAPGDFTGVYSTNFGLMALKRTGSSVKGCYTHDKGTLTGTVSGNVLSGTWKEEPHKTDTDRGGFVFTKTSTGFNGTWNYDSNGGLAKLKASPSSSSTWTGTIVSSEAPCTP
jgi:hypothetical protein